MESNQNKCKSCNIINTLDANKCCKCSQELTPSHTNQELIDQFIAFTTTDRNTAIQYLRMSTSINNAVQLYFESENSDMDIDEQLDNQDNYSFESAVDEFMSMAQGIPAMRTMLQNGRLSNIVSLLERVEQSVTEYEYPETIEQYTIQMLYTWGKNVPHYCPPCAARAFITFIKLKNIDSYNALRLIPPRILEHNNIDTQEKKEKLVLDILNNIDQFYDKISENLIKPFDMIYEKYVDKGEDTNDEFLLNIEHNLDNNYRIIWESLHQNDISQVIPKENRINKLNELATSETFIQFITNQWTAKTYNHPASEEALSCLKHENLDSHEKIIKLNLTNEKCAICFDEFKIGTEITQLSCHTFCKECIVPWLSKHNNTCPVCRKEINGDQKCPPAPTTSLTLPTTSLTLPTKSNNSD
jgi:hypothetical protein